MPEDDPFRKIEPSDLKDLAAVAQTLDDQWVPRAMLADMIESGRGFADVEAEREAIVRTEYLRAVLNSEQLVVNRAFFSNTPVIRRDFESPGRDREAFRRLLADEVLVPFLYKETAPYDREGSEYDEPPAATLWREIARDTHMACLRLSWEPDTSLNDELIRDGLSRRFHEFVETMRTKCVGGGDRVFASHLKLPDDALEPMTRRMGEVRDWAQRHSDNNVLVTRTMFYADFVAADNTRILEGRYAKDKPFAAELKLLIDLAYNTALPESIDRFPLRPEDSVHRAALQEWRGKQKPNMVSAEEVADSLIKQRLAFDRGQASLQVPALAGLGMRHIAAARETEQWARYIAALGRLVEHPELYEDQSTVLRDRYGVLLQELAKIVGADGPTVPVRPQIGFNLDFAGVLVKVRYFAQGAVYQIFGEAPASAGNTTGTSRVVVTGDVLGQAIARESGHHLAADLQTFRVGNVRRFVTQLRTQLKSAGVAEVTSGSSTRDGGLEQDVAAGG
jgi:hypothetical protein